MSARTAPESTLAQRKPLAIKQLKGESRDSGLLDLLLSNFLHIHGLEVSRAKCKDSLIGVHSAKFDNEETETSVGLSCATTSSIQCWIDGFGVWQQYATVRAWPYVDGN